MSHFTMKLTQLILCYLVCNKIFIANAAIKRNRLNVKQSSTPDSDAYYEKTENIKGMYKNDNNGILMKAMLMECPRSGEEEKSSVFFQQEEKSKGHDMCQDKILVTISMENTKKLGKGDDKYLVIDEVYDSNIKTKAKLLNPYVIEIKRSNPVLLYPLQVVENLTSNKCVKFTNAHPNEEQSEEDVDKIAHKYFNLGKNEQSLYKNPFVSNNRENVESYRNLNKGYQDVKSDVTVTKRQRDPIRACHCNTCQFCNPEITEDEQLESSQTCNCAECRHCLGEEKFKTKTNPVDTRESDVTVFETRDNRKIFQYPSIENIQNNKKQGIAESGSKEIQYSANKIGIVKNNELKPSFAQNGQISYDKSNLKGQQRDHMKNEDMYLDARKPVGREFNTFLDHKNIINNRYEDTNTLVKFEDTPSALYHEPNHEDTKDVVYYSDYYEDDTNLPSISDDPSLWTVADSANVDDINVYSNTLNEQYLKSNDRKEQTGNEIKNLKLDKKYDALMMDRNLTPNDKIQFLATNFDPLFGQDVITNNNRNHVAKGMKYSQDIEHHKIRNKRAFYDDMSYFDDSNGLLENSKYNGDWYRYLTANFPQLSNNEQKQQQDNQKTTADIIKEVENINNGNNNDKSVSSGKQKLFKEEKGKQRSYSVDKLWTVFKINAPLPFVQIKIRIFQKQDSVWNKIYQDINISNYLSHYVDKKQLITLSFHTPLLKNKTNYDFMIEEKGKFLYQQQHNQPKYNVQNTNLFNLFHHYLLIAPHSSPMSQNASTALLSKIDDFFVFDLPIIYNKNNNTSNRSLHWKILEKICNGLLTTTRQSQGRNQHNNAVDKRKSTTTASLDHRKITSVTRGNENERITDENKKRDAFNLYNDNNSSTSMGNTTITFAKLNQLPNFPVVSHDDKVINDCPKDIRIRNMKEYQNCLFVESNQAIFQGYQLTMKFLNIDSSAVVYQKNKTHIKNTTQVSIHHHSTPIRSGNNERERQHVRITNIFIDGTIYALLIIRVFLTNYGTRETNFTVMIDDYTRSNILGKIDVEREIILRPNKEKMVEFGLRHSIIHDNMRQIKCSVKVLSLKDVISSREFLIQPKSRCFCVSYCECLCIGAYFDTKQEGIVSCHVIKSKSKIQAGFMDSFPENIYYDEEQLPTDAKLIFDPVSLLFLPLFVLLLVFFLGLLKALLGLCIQPIGKWGYNYMQPFHRYDRSTKCRQFRMNLIFFFIVPCLYCCSKCCGKWKDLSNLGTASDRLEKGRLKKQFIIKQEKYEVNEDSLIDSDIDSDVPSEHTNLLYPFSHKKNKKKNDRINNNNNRQVADVAPQNNNNHSKNDHSRPSAGYSVDYTIDEEEEEEDTGFVLSALTESRDSMRCLDGLHSNDHDDDKYSSEVNAYIKTLFGSQMVYRVFNHPVGNIVVENGQKYSIRGFFIPSLGKKYKFITNLPMRQHWKIDENSQSLLPVFPPIVILSREFTKVYENKQDVFDSKDLLIKPHINAPVLNMQLQAKYIYDDDEQ